MLARSLAVLALALALAASAAAQPGQRATTLYADVWGPTGAYALGVERAVWTASESERELRLRLGVAYWTEALFPNGPSDRVLTIPAGATALFSLGEPLGVPAAFEFGLGAVFVRRSGERFGFVGESFALPVYSEAVVRAALGSRAGLRVGAVIGGEDSQWSVDAGGIRPVIGVGVGL
ncbi:MAG: hypothetical protein AAGI52_04430 [Bacteroidota bacterium]